MVIVDTALAKRAADGNPVRVALIGAGYMGRGITLQMVGGLVGMRLVAICNRSMAGAERAYADAGATPCRVSTAAELEAAISRDEYAVTDDPHVICAAGNVEAVIEATGEIEFGATVVLDAISHGKHVVLMNAELDATIGPMLKVYADRAGVVLTNTDGDEPGVAMTLLRFVKTLGFRPVMAGNIKGFIDPYRTPETQQAFAASVRQRAPMITSFADGTKLSMEATILANASGLTAGKRGMHGHRCAHVKEIVSAFTPEQLLEEGLVEYTLGAEPGTGAFVVGYDSSPRRAEYLAYFKMGQGPLYLFYTPYHLPHLQLALTVARAVLFHDPTVTPIGAPVCDVVAVAKRDLKAGERLDGIGGFTCYGAIDKYAVSRAGDLLPMGLSEGTRVLRDVAKDTAVGMADVSLPGGRVADRLRAEQNARFA